MPQIATDQLSVAMTEVITGTSICARVDPTVPRRSILRGIVVGGAAIAGVIGGWVGYRPSDAEAAVRCDAQPARVIGCGARYRPCFGPCSDNNSCCYHGDGQYDFKCCKCLGFCAPAQVVVYSSAKQCFFCCRYC